MSYRNYGKCDICGEEYLLIDMKKTFTGRSTKYICFKCRRNGNEQVGIRMQRHHEAKEKREQNK